MDIPSFYIPYNFKAVPPTSDEDPILTGTFTRYIPDDSYVFVEAGDHGKLFLNGEKEGVANVTYPYIYTARVKVGEFLNSLAIDNNYIMANPDLSVVPDPAYKFDKWTITAPASRAGEMLPYNFDETFLSLPEDEQIHIKANFVEDDNTKGKAVLSYTDEENGTRNFTMNFVYDNKDYKTGEVDPDLGETVIKVYDVPDVSNENNLPSWYYSSGSNVPIQGDNHLKPMYDEALLSYDKEPIDFINVKFRESFENFSNLQSLSCWFMPAYTEESEENPVYVFNTSIPDTFGGLENINTEHISNVNYMFGGYSNFYRAEDDAVSPEIICLDGFDQEQNLRNINGMFANCHRLNNILFEYNSASHTSAGKFNTTMIQNMTSTFYGCGNLFKNPESLTSILAEMDTSSLVDMSYMFADNPANSCSNTKKLYFAFPDSMDISKVKTMNHTFAGLQAQSLTIEDGDGLDFDTSSVIDMSYMFSDSGLMEFIPNKNFNTAQVTNMSHMFAFNTSLEDTTRLNMNDKFIMRDVKDCSYMFFGCSNLENFKLKCDSTMSGIDDARFMCTDSKRSKGRDGSEKYSVKTLGKLKYFDLTGLKINDVEYPAVYVDVLGQYMPTHSYTCMMNFNEEVLERITTDEA